MMEDGRWKMEEGRRERENGRWKMEDGAQLQSIMTDCRIEEY